MKEGSYEWALEQMRRGHEVCRIGGRLKYFLSEGELIVSTPHGREGRTFSVVEAIDKEQLTTYNDWLVSK